MSFLNDLVTLLGEDSVGTLNDDVFTSSKATVPMLASGRPTIHLVATGGTGAEFIQEDTARPAFLKPGVQVTVRANDPEVAFAKAQECMDSCFNVINRFIPSGGGNWHRRIHVLQSEPFELPVDDRKQARYTFNVVGDFNRRD